jgi:hypothetical protein
LAGKDYLRADYQLFFLKSKQVKRVFSIRKNQHNYKKQAYFFRKKRKHIETLSSQLCEQFRIRVNYAKLFKGFKTRV